MKTTFPRALLLAIALVAAPIHAQQTPVQQGIAAFNAGNYQQALDYFAAAESEGNTSESVQYNIAVSFYRLGRHVESEQRFLQLSGIPRWEVLVNYNLGLVNEALGRLNIAQDYYRLAAGQDEHEKIRTLAQEKLVQLQAEPRTLETAVGGVQVQRAAGKRWAFLSKLSAGANSNATSLADELIEESGAVEDNYRELLLYGHNYFWGNSGNGLRAYALAFDRTYDEFSYLDSMVGGVGATVEKRFGPVQTSIDLRLTQTRLDGNTVADQSQLKLAIARQFGFGALGLEYAISEFQAADAFEHIDGHQARTDLTWTKPFDDLRLKLRYRFEENDRHDLRRGNAFSSYSPDRSSISAEARWQVSRGFSATIDYEFIDSDYPEVNTLRDSDGRVKQQVRENEKTRAGLALEYRISPKWKASLGYRFTDVDDNYAIYTYDQGVVTAGIEFQL